MVCKGYNKKTRLWKPDNKHNIKEEWKRDFDETELEAETKTSSSWTLGDSSPFSLYTRNFTVSAVFMLGSTRSCRRRWRMFDWQGLWRMLRICRPLISGIPMRWCQWGGCRIIPMLWSVSCTRWLCTLANHTVRLGSRLMRRQETGMMHMCGGKHMRRISRNWGIHWYTMRGVCWGPMVRGKCVCLVARYRESLEATPSLCQAVERLTPQYVSLLSE